MLSRISMVFFVVAALVPIITSAPLIDVAENDVATRCPNMFTYVDRSTTGKWTGILVTRSTEDLHGVWMRLIFDIPVSDVEANGFKSVITDDDKYDILIKNRELLLKANQKLTLKITVKYEGSRIPSLIEYRLNARNMCPDQKISTSEVFQGDDDSKNFLPSLISAAKHIPKQQNRCGVRPSNNDQIYPWHSSLFVKYDGKEQFVCEATLIDQYHVLTAAHCVTNTQNGKPISRSAISVYLGEDGASKSAIRTNVSELFIHSEYEFGTIFNDLAILKLGVGLNFNDYVMPICLNDGIHKSGSAIVGYGVGEKENRQVRSENVAEISKEECLKRAPHLQNVLKDETCVLYVEGNRKCTGNSGSNYVSNKGDVSTLQGIVALGVKLQNKECNENSVALVTDVSKYSGWIQRLLNEGSTEDGK